MEGRLVKKDGETNQPQEIDESLPMALPGVPRNSFTLAKTGLAGKVTAVPKEDTDPVDFERQRRAFMSARNRQTQTVEFSKRQVKGEAAAVETFKGPWAKYIPAEEPRTGPSDEELAHLQQAKMAAMSALPAQRIEPGQERTLFHGKRAGKSGGLAASFMDLPMDAPDHYRYPVDSATRKCSAPRRAVHTWLGHARGVTVARIIPSTGHLVLSGSMDCRAKIWSILGDRSCQRTYIGHNKPVRDLSFSVVDAGGHFASASFDGFCKHWDTETGQCVVAIEHKRMPTCVRYCEKRPDLLLVGGTDGKVCLWDLRVMRVAREYAGHTDAINSITWLPNVEGSEEEVFATTSEDKSVRVWRLVEEKAPLQILQKPNVYDAYPAVSVHPTEPCLLFSSTATSIIQPMTVVQAAPGRPALRPKHRAIAGHQTGGTVCRPAVSPDGRILAAGDARGQVNFWDWTSGQPSKAAFQAHEAAVTDLLWCPHDDHHLITASLDSSLKLWE